MIAHRKPKRVVIVDDSRAFAQRWADMLRQRYGEAVSVETYLHPYDALPRIDNTIDLLIADLEIPGMDGERFIDYAREHGVQAGRIIITSAEPAEELHRRFALGEAIAVINKTEPKQQEAFLMILESVMKR